MDDNSSLGRKALGYAIDILPDNLVVNTAITFAGVTAILGQDLIRQGAKKLEDKLSILHDKSQGLRYELNNTLPYFPVLF
ncbi:MAG: hypothetical protein AABX35_02180 [Nanoarchaeota archaeon]